MTKAENQFSAIDLDAAKKLDEVDPLRDLRSQFHLPSDSGVEDVYFVGNSLGLMPRRVADYLSEELENWRSLAVRGHFVGDRPWVSYHELLAQPMAELVGGQVDEVVTMNTLTVNLHLMMATFYRPDSSRYKILIEDHAFPSDHYAVESQIRWHGLNPQDAMVLVRPDPGQQLLSTERICATIEEHAESLALVMLPGVQYYTGQVLDMPAITKAAHRFGIAVGFDLAHAAGNIPMQLHDWDVDFAAWCTYKYLNSGPGSLAGCFVHQRHATNTDLNRLSGWWGHDKESRYQMENEFIPIPTAEGWQLSNPPILSLAAIRASLDVFEEAGGMLPLREKSRKMHDFFRSCLKSVLGDRVDVIAPAEQSGCQLSLEVKLSGIEGETVYKRLESKGIRTDWREPNVIRAAPTPLYNTYEEVWKFVSALEECLN